MAAPVHAFPMFRAQAEVVAEKHDRAWVGTYKAMGEPFAAVLTRDGETIETLAKDFDGSEYPSTHFEYDEIEAA